MPAWICGPHAVLWNPFSAPYRCTRIYGDRRFCLEPAECSSAVLKNEITTNHIYEYWNKYPCFLRPLKCVSKYWGYKEVSEKLYESVTAYEEDNTRPSVCWEAVQEDWHHWSDYFSVVSEAQNITEAVKVVVMSLLTYICQVDVGLVSTRMVMFKLWF